MTETKADSRVEIDQFSKFIHIWKS